MCFSFLSSLDCSSKNSNESSTNQSDKEEAYIPSASYKRPRESHLTCMPQSGGFFPASELMHQHIVELQQVGMDCTGSRLGTIVSICLVLQYIIFIAVRSTQTLKLLEWNYPNQQIL